MILVFDDIFHVASAEVFFSYNQLVEGESAAIGKQNAHAGLCAYPAIGAAVFIERDDAVFLYERAVGGSQLATGLAFTVAVEAVAVGSEQDFAVFR